MRESFLKIVVTKASLFIDDEVDPLTPCREHVVLEWRRTVLGVNNMARLVVQRGNPFRVFSSVGNGSREENETNLSGNMSD